MSTPKPARLHAGVLPPPPTYPTPWVAVTHSFGYRGFQARIERMVSTTRREARACPHMHSRRDLAQKCAEKMLGDPRMFTPLAPGGE